MVRIVVGSFIIVLLTIKPLVASGLLFLIFVAPIEFDIPVKVPVSWILLEDIRDGVVDGVVSLGNISEHFKLLSIVF